MTVNIHDSSKTKIIATIGPASSSEDRLRELIISGIDMCRLNFSHGDHDQHNKVIRSIRKLNKELGTHIAILADLQGPKIRLGEMEEDVFVQDGDKIIFTNEDVKGNNQKVHISYDHLPKDVKKGDAILIDDGKLKFIVESTDSKNRITAGTVHGGQLLSRKGVNLPDTRISIPSLTEKDIEDVHFILDHDLDWIALSFVRKATDITDLKKIIKDRDKRAMVIAKIEKPEALQDIDRIIDESDAVMVARGDLGVEVSFDKVPYIQKQIVQKCIRKSTPVIIATQMLESMITNFRPTRAEANDVANAVFDCADTVMLSGETSIGKYPVEAICNMQKIIDYAEETEFVLKHEHLPELDSHTYIPDSVCYNASKLADQSGARAIIAFAAIPETAFRLASNRPKAPIYVFTHDIKLIYQLSIIWGVRAFLTEHDVNAASAVENSLEILKQKGLIRTGDIVLHVSSIPVFDKSGVNSIKLSYV
jgi:pyruvate kinase